MKNIRSTEEKIIEMLKLRAAGGNASELSRKYEYAKNSIYALEPP